MPVPARHTRRTEIDTRGIASDPKAERIPDQRRLTRSHLLHIVILRKDFAIFKKGCFDGCLEIYIFLFFEQLVKRTLCCAT